jgi:hypothetical protein
MRNQFRTNVVTPYRLILDFDISKSEKHYRLSPGRRDENKRISLGSLYTIRPGLTGSFGVTDSRIFGRSAITGGAFQDFIIDDQTVSATLSHAGTIEPRYVYFMNFPRFTTSALRFDWRANASVGQGERTYKTDDTMGGSVGGGVAYNFGKRVVVQGRGALRQSNETSRTTLEEFNGLGASEDSLSGVVRVFLADSISIRGDYKMFNGDRRYTDQATGSLGGQVGGVENVFEEHETRDSHFAQIALDSRLWQGFRLNLTATNDEQLYDYAIQQTRYSRTVVNSAKGVVDYAMPWGTFANVQFENLETLRDLGPLSISSYSERRKRASVGLRHPFTSTLSLSFNGSTQLTQQFYLDYDENPRDRDQVDNIFNIRLSSQPYKKISASISTTYSSTDVINIDASQARLNRTRQLYEMRPSFTYTMNDRVQITQSYALVIEFTEYDNRESDNYLDRNLTFTNTAMLRPLDHVRFRFDYALYLHDRGSYLRPNGDPELERVLDIDSEDRRDRMTLRVDYDVTPGVTIFAENIYSNFRNRDIALDSETDTQDGSVKVGASGEKKWSDSRKLKFRLARVKRFSPFGSPEEKDFWDMYSEFNFQF